MTQSLITVVLFIALLGAMPFALRRLQQHRLGAAGVDLGSASKLLSTVALGPQQRVVTVEVGPQGARTWLVLGVTGQAITCLHALPATVEGTIDV